eukprot:4660767-Prorocentrum_lima.AAC.1
MAMYDFSTFSRRARMASKKPLLPVLEKLAPCSSTLPPTLRKDGMSARSFPTVTLEAASSK